MLIILLALHDNCQEVIYAIKKSPSISFTNVSQVLSDLVNVANIILDAIYSPADLFSLSYWPVIPMASTASFVMTIQLLFYWLSLFEATSFYVTMLIESVNDVKYFFVMVVLCIMSFANSILIL